MSCPGSTRSSKEPDQGDRQAKQAGVPESEIAEALLVSRPMKMANDTAADALAWLEENRK